MSVSYFADRTRAYIKIQDGCDHACTYCKVVLVRGKSRSRPFEEIIQEGIDQRVFDFPEPDMAVKAILGVANWTIMWFNPDGRLSATEIADLSADLILNGLFERKVEEK